MLRLRGASPTTGRGREADGRSASLIPSVNRAQLALGASSSREMAWARVDHDYRASGELDGALISETRRPSSTTHGRLGTPQHG